MTTILIVEDDPLQASVLVSLLGRQFGEVFRVTDAAEALCLVEQPEFANKLSLVISRHHSVGIGGPAFVSELRSRMPHLPILVLGGAEATASDYSADHVIFLPRPFAAEKMLSLTSQMLAQRKTAVV